MDKPRSRLVPKNATNTILTRISGNRDPKGRHRKKRHRTDENVSKDTSENPSEDTLENNC